MRWIIAQHETTAEKSCLPAVIESDMAPDYCPMCGRREMEVIPAPPMPGNGRIWPARVQISARSNDLRALAQLPHPDGDDERGRRILGWLMRYVPVDGRVELSVEWPVTW